MDYINIEDLNIELEKVGYVDEKKRKKRLMAYAFKAAREQTKWFDST